MSEETVLSTSLVDRLADQLKELAALLGTFAGAMRRSSSADAQAKGLSGNRWSFSTSRTIMGGTPSSRLAFEIRGRDQRQRSIADHCLDQSNMWAVPAGVKISSLFRK